MRCAGVEFPMKTADVDFDAPVRFGFWIYLDCSRNRRRRDSRALFGAPAPPLEADALRSGWVPRRYSQIPLAKCTGESPRV